MIVLFWPVVVTLDEMRLESTATFAVTNDFFWLELRTLILELDADREVDADDVSPCP